MKFKKRMTNVYSKQVEDLVLLVPNFKVASAIIHYDETSPHMHTVGVPIKTKSKYGKEKQLESNQQKIEIANQKALELDTISNETKDIVKYLKNTLTSKDKYILKQEDEDKLLNYIDKVNKTNNEFKKIKELSITLNNVDIELKENREQIKILTENNNALQLRVETLDNKVNAKNEKIDELKEENSLLKTLLENLQKLFDRLIKFLKDRMFNKKEKDKYYDMSYELYKRDIISNDDMLKIKDNYDKSDSKNHNNDLEL